METTITERGQTAVPAAIRKKYNLKSHTKLEWIETLNGISVIPIPDDPITAFRGVFKDSRLTTEALLKDRAKEREQERRKYNR